MILDEGFYKGYKVYLVGINTRNGWLTYQLEIVSLEVLAYQAAFARE